MRCVDGLDIFDMGGDDYSSGLEVDVRRKLLEANDVAGDSLAALALEPPERESGAPLGVGPFCPKPGDVARHAASTQPPGCPPQLQSLIAKALAKKREDRFSSITEVGEES